MYFLCCGRMFSPVARFCSQGHHRLKELPVNMQTSFQLPCLGPASFVYDMIFCCRLFVYSEYSVFRTLAYWLFLQLNPDLQLMPSHTTVLSFFNRFVPFSHTTAPSPSSRVCTIFKCYCTLLQQVCTIFTLYSPFFPHRFQPFSHCPHLFQHKLYYFYSVLIFFNMFVLFVHCPHLFQQVCTICTMSLPFLTGLPFSHCPHLFQQVCTICALSSYFSSGLYHLHSPHIFNWFVAFSYTKAPSFSGFVAS